MKLSKKRVFKGGKCIERCIAEEEASLDTRSKLQGLLRYVPLSRHLSKDHALWLLLMAPVMSTHLRIVSFIKNMVTLQVE